MQNVKIVRFSFLKVLIVQCVVVAVLAGLLFSVKKLSPKDYEAVAEQYVDVMENEASGASVKKTWSKIKGFFVDSQNKPVTENAGGKDEDAEGNRYPDNCSAAKYVINEDICRPANGEISSPFGFRINPVSGEKSFHTGIDIAADAGSPVKAAYYGMIIEADKDDVYGNYIRINHGNGIESFYAHCSKLLVKTGDIVNAGQIIARVGSTGWSTGPHLHFSLIIDDIYCNPGYLID